MLDIIFIVFFGVMAIRVAVAVVQESRIFREFNQSRSLALVVLLFPLGPIVYLASVFRLGWVIAVIAAAACYLPGLVIARQRLSAFERAGTDRVRKARNAATQAFGTAIAGLLYSAIVLVFTLIGATSGEPSA